MTKIQGLTLALILSLGGNLYAATFIAGHHAHQHIAAGNMAHHQLDMILGSLPQDKQDAIREDMDEDLDELKMQFKDARKNREQLSQLLTAPELDKAAINAQFARMRENTTHSQEKMQHIMLATFDKMSPQERKAAIDRITKHEKPEKK